MPVYQACNQKDIKMSISLTYRNIEELSDNLKQFGFIVPDDFSNDDMQKLVEIILDTLEIEMSEC
jgi:hypothetical protein